MKKILIHNSVSCFDYSALSSFHSCYQYFYNSGNCVFFFAFENFLRTCNIDYECSTNYPADYINEHFSCVIELRANLFSKNCKCLDYYYKSLIGVKIPIFFLTTGIQLEKESEFESLISVIGDKSKRLIDLVYSTGGEFGLRGNYSKFFFDQISDNTAEVIGCTSILLANKDLNVSNNKVDKNNFKPVINGHIQDLKSKYYETIISKNNIVAYLDQDEFGKILYQQKNENYIRLVRLYSKLGVDLLCKSKVKSFYSVPEWSNYLKNNCNFVFGTRIHGAILPILNQISSLVFVKDLRVKELCDFYSIPYIYGGGEVVSDLYELYQRTDFSEFNGKFSKQYDLLIHFLVNHKIISSSDLENSDQNNGFNVDLASLKKANNSIKVLSKIELILRLYYMQMKYKFALNKSKQDILLDIRAVKYLLGKLKI